MYSSAPARRVCACVLALLLVAPLPLAHAAAGARMLERIGWLDGEALKPQKRWEAFDTANLNVFDVDGDGLPEIITQNDNNRVYVIDPRNRTILAELTTTHPGGDTWSARELGGVAVGDINGNGRTDLVVANSAAYLTAFQYNPEGSTSTHFRFDKLWEVFADPEEFDRNYEQTHPWLSNWTDAQRYPGLDGNPYIGDVNNDGTQEIFVQTDGKPGQMSFTHEGELRWMKTFWDGNAGPVVADLDGDGRKEAVFASDAGVVVAYSADSGNIKWQFDASKQGAMPGSIAVMPTVIDIDGDGKNETFVVARVAVKPEANASNEADNDSWIQEQHAKFFALNHDGTLRWAGQYSPWGNPHAYMHPAAADVNEDGVFDLIWVDWNTIGHNPGNWETTGRPSNLMAIDGRSGEALWHRGVDATWSNKDIVVADIDGDGKEEILVEDQDSGYDGLSIFGLDGRRIDHVRMPTGWLISRGPVAADLYGDGHVYIILPLYRESEGCDRPQLDVGCREGALAIYRGAGRIEDASWSNNVLFNADLHSAHDVHDRLSTNLAKRPTPPKVVVTPPGPLPPSPGEEGYEGPEAGAWFFMPGAGLPLVGASVALAVIASRRWQKGRGGAG